MPDAGDLLCTFCDDNVWSYVDISRTAVYQMEFYC